MPRIKDLSNEELINICLDFADENDDFDISFVKKMEECIDEYGDLTEGQRKALENIVETWNMMG